MPLIALKEVTPCPCCNGDDCLNIDHGPYRTVEYNRLLTQWRIEAAWEEFHTKQRDETMREFHKQRRQELERQLETIEAQ